MDPALIVLLVVLGLAGVGLLLVVVVALAAWASVTGMSGDALRLERMGWDSSELEEALDDHAWAEAHGFDWEDALTMTAPGNPRALIFAWRIPGEATFFCSYRVATRRFVDFVTIFSHQDLSGLTTSSSADGLVNPVPESSFRQAFPGRSLDELWRLHREGEAYLIHRRGIAQVEVTAPLEVLIRDSIRMQMAHVRAHALWPLRFAWWYFTRGRRANRPVAGAVA